MSYMYIRIFHIYSNIFLRLEFYRKCIRNIQLAVLTSYEFAREKNVCDLRVFALLTNICSQKSVLKSIYSKATKFEFT